VVGATVEDDAAAIVNGLLAQGSPVTGRDEGGPVVGVGMFFAFEHVALGVVEGDSAAFALF
jgi:hypothetical protein